MYVCAVVCMQLYLLRIYTKYCAGIQSTKTRFFRNIKLSALDHNYRFPILLEYKCKNLEYGITQIISLQIVQQSEE